MHHQIFQRKVGILENFYFSRLRWTFRIHDLKLEFQKPSFPGWGASPDFLTWSWNYRNLNVCRFRCSSRLLTRISQITVLIVHPLLIHFINFVTFLTWGLNYKNLHFAGWCAPPDFATLAFEICSWNFKKPFFAGLGSSPDCLTWSWNSRNLYFWRFRSIIRFSYSKWNFRHLYLCRL